MTQRANAKRNIAPRTPAKKQSVHVKTPSTLIQRRKKTESQCAKTESQRARISSKGQITVPQPVRERLGVRAGDEVEFVFDGSRTVVKPVRPEEDPFAKWVGIARNVPSGYDPIADQREMRGWDAWDYEQYG